MAGRIALDTNVVVPLLGGDGGIVVRAAAAAVFLPLMVVGELYFGAEKSGRPVQNVARIDALIERIVVLPCDVATAREFGRIKGALRAKGRPIPDNDVWIAAAAVQHGLTLATRDAHFDAVDG
ncbi:MAG: PilT protein domain protein [Phycisphaerales bacterium]|nr:PilT protein domain protein [Phycisphaerales bacterium]